MPIVSQGTTQEFRVGATDGIFVKCTGSAAITYDGEYSAPTLADTSTGEVRCGYFGVPATIRVNCVSGTCEVNTQPTVIKPLVSKQGGAVQDSSALDMVETVNAAATISTQNKNKLTRRPYANQLLNGNGGSFAAANTTIAQMIMIPHEFVAVRIGYAMRGGSGALTDAKFLVATTDNIGDFSQTQTDSGRQYVVPVKSGVTYNDISANGWQVVTFSGSATVSAPDAGANNFSYVFSDLIPLKAIPLSGNPERFKGSYPLLVRMFAGTANYTKGGLTGFGATDGFIEESGKFLQLGCARAGDSVATPSGLTAASTVAFGDDKSLPIIVQAYTNAGAAKTILSAGDSRFASSSEFPSKVYRCLQFFIEQQAAEVGLDYKCVSVAQGGQTMDAYNQRAVAYINANGFADASLYLGYSINDGVPTDSIMQNSKLKLITFIEACRAKGIVPLIVTAFPLGTGYTTQSANLLTDFVNFVAALGVPYIDPLSIYGQSPNYAWNPQYQFDNSHMTDAGYQDLAARCIKLISESV